MFGTLWIITLFGALVAGEILRAELREWAARRRASRRGRTLTAKYGIPWR